MVKRFNIYQVGETREENFRDCSIKHKLIYKDSGASLEEAEEKLKNYPHFVEYVIIPSYTNYPF